MPCEFSIFMANLLVASSTSGGVRKKRHMLGFSEQKAKRHPFSHASSDDDAYFQSFSHENDETFSVDEDDDQYEKRLSLANAERARKVVQRFADRLARSKRRITQRPPTPTSSSGSSTPNVDGAAASGQSEDDRNDHTSQQQKQQERMKKKLALIFGDDPLAAGAGGKISQNQQQLEFTLPWIGRVIRLPTWLTVTSLRTFFVSSTIAPHSYFYILWLAIVTLSFLYNAFSIPLRTTFHESTPNAVWWFVADYVCDLTYLIDLLCFRPLVQFVEAGILYDTRRDTARHFFRSRLFIIDLISLLPLDLLYLAAGIVPALRFSRLLKIHCYWECFSRIETAVSFPNLLRILKTELYLVYLVHLNAGIYYVISHREVTVNKMHNEWLHYYYEAVEGQSAYVRCFYHSLKMAAKIGLNPQPLTSIQRAHQGLSIVFGIWLFAVLIGQIEDIYEGVTGRQDEFRHKLDRTLQYLKKVKMPSVDIKRARAWFIYSWKFQKALDENEFLAFLPRKLQTDLAINVHFNTLAKVTLFHDVEQGLLRALVSSLRPRIYLPGEFICKKGEVGKEMFIIKYGLVEILGGPQNRTVFATLGEGTVIGEISLLSLAGGDNRRTADVRSKGVSQLFVLSKRDLEYHLQDYPAAEKLLKKKAHNIMKQNAERRKEAEEKFRRELEESLGIEPSDNDHLHRSSNNNDSEKKHNTTGLDSMASPTREENRFAQLVIKLLPQASALRERLGGGGATAAGWETRPPSQASSVISFASSTTNATSTPLKDLKSPMRRRTFNMFDSSSSSSNRHAMLRVFNAVRFLTRVSASRRVSLNTIGEQQSYDEHAVQLKLNRVAPAHDDAANSFENYPPGV